MNNLKSISLIVGIVVEALGVLGLVMGEGRAMEEMNINLLLDVARIGLGALLVWGGMRTAETARTALGIFGIAYLGMFLVGLISNDLFGLAPAGLGVIDQALHLGGGVLAIILAMVPARRTLGLR